MYEFQMQYGSIGWVVGVTLGYAQAARNKRVIASIGDGSFQVTAQAVSTMLRCEQRTIIFRIEPENFCFLVDAFIVLIYRVLDHTPLSLIRDRIKQRWFTIAIGLRSTTGEGIEKLGYERMHDGYGFGDKNEASESILDFALASNLVVANIMYKKRYEHLIAFKSGSTRSQIDYFLARKIDRPKCNNYKVIPGENLTSQHRILVIDLCFKRKYQAKKDNGRRMTRRWDLKGDKLEIFTNRMVKEDT
ncbi:uncharacterized protein LOC114309161 [Camellia sinensis]|uniref:uncharacterized protein LOC114309161 n=1 Tax=Camellia sinensis TaxID=4442 RepID=UPI0010358F15|nr:uncharacterized protein LOC114309161 [Camellia sinensis]